MSHSEESRLGRTEIAKQLVLGDMQEAATGLYA